MRAKVFHFCFPFYILLGAFLALRTLRNLGPEDHWLKVGVAILFSGVLGVEIVYAYSQRHNQERVAPRTLWTTAFCVIATVTIYFMPSLFRYLLQ